MCAVLKTVVPRLRKEALGKSSEEQNGEKGREQQSLWAEAVDRPSTRQLAWSLESEVGDRWHYSQRGQ